MTCAFNWGRIASINPLYREQLLTLKEIPKNLFGGIRKQLRGSGFDGSWVLRNWQHSEVSQTWSITFLLNTFAILKHHWTERILKIGDSELSSVSQGGDIKIRNYYNQGQIFGEMGTWRRKPHDYHLFSGIFWFWIFMKWKDRVVFLFLTNES